MFKVLLEIYQIDPDSFFTAAGLAWEKKSNIKLDILIDSDMLLMVEKGIRGGACHAFHRIPERNT